VVEAVVPEEVVEEVIIAGEKSNSPSSTRNKAFYYLYFSKYK